MTNVTKTRRIVCTGLGIVSPLGIGTKKSWSALLSGKSGLKPLKQEHSFEGCQTKVAAYVDETELESHVKSDKHSYISKNSRQLSRATIISMLAVHEALEDAELLQDNEEGIKQKYRHRTGVAIGQGMVDFQDIYENASHLQTTKEKKGSFRKISPFFMTRALMNMSSGNSSIRFKLMGPNSCSSTACATGGHSIGEAFNFIRHGKADVMVCGSTESCINSLSIAGFERLKALSTKSYSNLNQASRPFDVDRSGFVMGEGAGIIVLEELEHARQRGLSSDSIYAEVLGFGSSSDGYHLTAPLPDGSGAVRCMNAAVKDAEISCDKITHVNAHATSTPMGDEIECTAIEKLFPGRENIPVTSLKGSFGHLLGAAGSVETIFAILSVYESIIPACLNLESPLKLEKNTIEFVRNRPKKWLVQNKSERILIKNSFGFGGTNASLIVGNLK